jgi:hypothetical protein
MDSSWVNYEHTDRLPNRYKTLSMWGVDAVTGQFTVYAFDNFHGHRKFASDGWKGNKLILTTNEYYPQRGLLFQHFIYEKLSDITFKMTYETSKDGIAWKLGDYLLFTKKIALIFSLLMAYLILMAKPLTKSLDLKLFISSLTFFSIAFA